jgi:DNA-binding NarL/FixJ family response regulator
VGMIRLLIVAGRPGLGKGLQMRLTAECDILVVGEVSNAAEALVKAKILCPDVVLIDQDIPSLDGIDVARQLHVICPESAIIILSLRDDPLTYNRAMAAGAAAFVVKSMPEETLLEAIRQAVP